MLQKFKSGKGEGTTHVPDRYHQLLKGTSGYYIILITNKNKG